MKRYIDNRLYYINPATKSERSSSHIELTLTIYIYILLTFISHCDCIIFLKGKLQSTTIYSSACLSNTVQRSIFNQTKINSMHIDC